MLPTHACPGASLPSLRPAAAAAARRSSPAQLRRCRCAASASAPTEEERSRLAAATRDIRRLGLAGDAPGAVALLAELGASGLTPDLMAVTATLVRPCVRAWWRERVC